jgi:hypothetical protein
MPMKWKFNTGFIYLSIPVDLDFLDHTEKCVYVPSLHAWTWVFTDSALFGPYIVRISLQWTVSRGWIFHINVHIALTGANKDIEWACGFQGAPNGFFIGTYPHGISPTVTAGLGFDGGPNPTVQSLFYFEEP